VTKLRAGRQRFDSRQNEGRESFGFATVSRPALVFTHPSSSGYRRHSVGVKWPGSEADRSSPSSAEAENTWSYTCSPPIRFYNVVFIYCCMA
jgi:hypothetical protein